MAASALRSSTSSPLSIPEVLTPEAMKFLVELARRFESTRVELLAARVKVQAEIDGGTLPDFPKETADVRAKEWTVAPIPKDLEDRRVGD